MDTIILCAGGHAKVILDMLETADERKFDGEKGTVVMAGAVVFSDLNWPGTYAGIPAKLL